MRDFLFYISCAKGVCEAELFNNNRLYDVAINDFTETNTNPSLAEYKFSKDEWKYRHVKHDLSNIVFNYKACAFFDDDVKISTEQINNLFEMGIKNNWNIWQASLTADSYSSWKHLYSKYNNLEARKTNTIEIMMPFFSKSALQKCWESFDINYSAWGLDVAWNYLLNNDKIMVVDAIPVHHVRPMRGHARIMPNGKTPKEDAELVFNHYKLNKKVNVF